MRLISLLLLFISLTACAPMVSIDYDRSVNFKSLTTFTVQTKPVKVDDDTRITTPFMQERIVNAINNELTNKGYKYKDNNSDVIIKYHIDVVRDLETDESTVSFGFGTSGHHSSIGMGFIIPVGEAYTIDNMVLTIDVVSTKTNKLIWRGTLGYRLDAGATPERYNRMANDLVREILTLYPPK
jgi:hypothetical protein